MCGLGKKLSRFEEGRGVSGYGSKGGGSHHDLRLRLLHGEERDYSDEEDTVDFSIIDFPKCTKWLIRVTTVL